jgi:hypothetical protein
MPGKKRKTKAPSKSENWPSHPEINFSEDKPIAAPPGEIENSLRILSRWLIASAGNSSDSQTSPRSQNSVDVARDSKLVSE